MDRSNAILASQIMTDLAVIIKILREFLEDFHQTEIKKKSLIICK